jgi:tetratricopeptide (TPR) repeat protein
MRGFLGILGALALVIAAALPAASKGAPDLKRCGKKVQSIKVCTRLIQSGKYGRKDLSFLHWNRGNAYVRLQKFKLAVADFDNAIKANWRFAYAYYARGLIYQYAMKKRERALKDFRMAYDLEPWVDQFADKLLTFGYLVPVRSRI